jgi:cell division protein FtsN
MGDNLYRVQVGPYNDAASAQAAQQLLIKAGFNSILKR